MRESPRIKYLLGLGEVKIPQHYGLCTTVMRVTMKLLANDETISLKLRRQKLITEEVFTIATKYCPTYLFDLVKSK